MWSDIRYALRGLRRSPGFTMVALLLLALGIGANTTVFSVASQVLLGGPAVADPAALMQLKFDDLANHVAGTGFSYPAFQAFSRTNPLVAGMYARSEQVQLNVAYRGQSDLAHAVFESGGAAGVLGIAPALGRLLNAGDGRPSGEAPPLILSYRYWQRRFAGDPAVIGKVAAINTMPFVIAGVTPASFHGIEMGIDPDITLPAYTADAIRGVPTVANAASWGFAILCRRRPGVTPAELEASLAPIYRGILDQFVAAVPASMAGSMKQFTSNLRFRVDPAPRGAASGSRDRMRQPLLLLMLITGLVFLVTCANLAGLMLARTQTRGAEIGIRLAIGCSRGRLLRQLLTESSVVALAGAAIGVLSAVWTGPLVASLLGEHQLRDALSFRPDAATLAYGLILAVLGGILLGLSPAVRAARIDPLVSIRRSSAAAGHNSRFARSLIVCQVALSLVLSLTAGQFIRSLRNYRDVDAGFRPDHLITITTRPALVRYDDARKIAYARRMYERLSALPGVQSVTYSTSAIGQLTWNTLVNVPGYVPTARLDDTVGRNIAGPRFIETLGLTLIAGRDFDLRDGGGAPATVIVNQSFARRFFHTDDVIGRQISFIDSSRRRDTIVGLVRDARDRGVHESAKPVVYSNYEKDPLGWITFSIRVRHEPEALLGRITSIFSAEDPAVPLDQPRTVVAQMDEALERERVLAALSAALGMLATVIAMVGLYGLLAYSVSRRTREIGIRIALGALPGQVRSLAVRESALLLAGGALLGWPAYFAVARLLQAQVYQVTPQDPAVIAGAVCLLLVGGGVATLLPAWRSARVSPIQALKYD